MPASCPACLTLKVALTLISETVRFWSDVQTGARGEALPPRCLDAARLGELRESLIRVNEHCKSGLRQAEKEAKNVQS